MRSAVSMLSLIRTGIPCSGPRTCFPPRSLSSASAMARASGLTSITLLIVGPCLSISSMRARYLSVIDRALNFPEVMPACKSAMVISSNSKAFISASCAVEATSRAPARAGKTAALTPARALVCKKRRRWGDPQSTTASLLVKLLSPVQQVWYKRNGNYRLWVNQACQRSGAQCVTSGFVPRSGALRH